MDYKISGEEAQEILNYLVTRPWKDVDVHVKALHNIQPIEDAKEE